MRVPASPLLSAFAGVIVSFTLSGCSLSPTAAPSAQAGAAIHGIAHGGRQAISAAHVYLFAAGTSGYGTASTSLLNSTSTGYSDSIGAYVPTDAGGYFTITGDYTCTANSQVYIYILGGNSGGGGVNSASGLMAILGNCPTGGSFAGAIPFVWVDEVSTIAAAYSLSGFATDATHVSSSGTPLALTGIANAFATAANLADISTGAALATTPAGNGIVPQSEINTLANILTTCINTADSGGISAACSTLFSDAPSNGTTGTTPTDTASAAINIAHNPGSNIDALYGLTTGQMAFSPALSGQPNDFTIGLNFTGGGLYSPYAIAIDGSGNAWIANYNNSSLSKLSSAGAAISGSSGYIGGGLNSPTNIAFDGSGNAWIANYGNSSISKFSSTGDAISGTSGYSGGGLTSPYGIAIDSSGNAWIANYGNSSISKFSSTGTAISGSSGYSGGGLYSPYGIAIDGSGNVWVGNIGNNSVSKFSSTGDAISGTNGYTGGGLNHSNRMAIDGSGNVWIGNIGNNTVSKFSSTGSALSGSSGYTGGGLYYPHGIAIDGSGNVWTANYNNSTISKFSSTGTAISGSSGYTGGGLFTPSAIAIDGSGNAWIANINNNSVTEFIGAATPVITPIMAALPTTPTSDGTSNLGTRP